MGKNEFLLSHLEFLKANIVTVNYFVYVDALHPSQQLFSFARMISCLSGLNQY